MVRVIAGSARGIRLKAPKGDWARPTSDRVKESLFAMLDPHLEGKKVLDLYAGTGSLGIEALSRGAKQAVFVEKDRRTAHILLENLQKARMGDTSQVIVAAVPPTRGTIGLDIPFDLIFMDPPYDRGQVAKALAWIDREGVCASGGLVVVERSRLEDIPSNLTNLALAREKEYNETVIDVFQAR